MSEIPIAFDIQPTREERARVFLGDHLTAEDKENAQDLARFFSTDKPMASTAVLIPVAAHQDAEHVYHAMSQYAA